MPSEGKRAALAEGKRVQAFRVRVGFCGGRQNRQSREGVVFIKTKRRIETARGYRFDDLPDSGNLHKLAADYGLGKGDLVFTGTPSGVGAIGAGDNLALELDGLVRASFTVGC